MRWKFIIPPLLVWTSAIIIAILDFAYVQGMAYIFDLSESIGLIMVLVGFSVRKTAKKTLGNYLSSRVNSIRKHKLVRNGIYRHIRHPMYLGAILLNLGAFLLLSMYGFLVMLGFIPCVLYRIRIEEKTLVEKFGKEYRDYMMKTKKIIPFFY